MNHSFSRLSDGRKRQSILMYLVCFSMPYWFFLCPAGSFSALPVLFMSCRFIFMPCRFFLCPAGSFYVLPVHFYALPVLFMPCRFFLCITCFHDAQLSFRISHSDNRAFDLTSFTRFERRYNYKEYRVP